ncbi:unnamed protein product, partial [Amoebophrya sp. A120]
YPAQGYEGLLELAHMGTYTPEVPFCPEWGRVENYDYYLGDLCHIHLNRDPYAQWTLKDYNTQNWNPPDSASTAMTLEQVNQASRLCQQAHAYVNW